MILTGPPPPAQRPVEVAINSAYQRSTPEGALIDDALTDWDSGPSGWASSMAIPESVSLRRRPSENSSERRRTRPTADGCGGSVCGQSPSFGYEHASFRLLA